MDELPKFTRDVLMSIRPTYASKILEGQKTVELRRRFPERTSDRATALIYSSSPVRAIVGYAQIRCVLRLPVSRIWNEHGNAACISKREFDAYFAGLRYGFAILLESVRPLKKRVGARELAVQFGIVPPQSYRYLTQACVALLSDEPFQTPDRHKRGDRARGRTARSVISS
jgi:predicted transcriptional regulator